MMLEFSSSGLPCVGDEVAERLVSEKVAAFDFHRHGMVRLWSCHAGYQIMYHCENVVAVEN